MSISISGSGGITGATTSYSFDQSVSIGGTLTYEDVTNIDSVGVITARQGLDTPTNLVLRTGGTERLRITSAGLVGIGTDNPDRLLHLKAASSTAYSGGDDSADYNLLKIQNTTDDKSAGIFFQIGSNGEAAITATEVSDGNCDIAFQNRGGGVRSEKLRLDSSGRLLVGMSSARSNLSSHWGAAFTPPIQVETGGDTNNSGIALINNSTTTYSPTLSFACSRANTIGSNTIIGNGQSLGYINWSGSDGTNFLRAAQISAFVDGTPGTDVMPGCLVFSTNAGASSPTERMRIQNGGNILIHKTSGGLGVDGLELSNTGGTNVTITQSGNGVSAFSVNMRYGAGDQYPFYFYYNGAFVGNINVTSTATAYVTSSDYRLKENVQVLSNAINRLQQLKPSRFNFIVEPDKIFDGFLAHEVQNIVPEAISGEKDAVDDEGNPQYQGIDQSKLVPLLAAALQEAIAKIETLETKVQALEGS